MKKKILIILIAVIIMLGITGCNNSSVTIDELNNINNKIIDYFSSDSVEYYNLAYNYVDEKNKVVIVGLLENTKYEQEKFKELVINSDLIKFVEGERIADVS